MGNTIKARVRLGRSRARGAGASEDVPKGHRTGPRIRLTRFFFLFILIR